MPDSSDATNRGKLMRQIAALHAKMSNNFREPGQTGLTEAERQAILGQIVDLEKQLMKL